MQSTREKLLCQYRYDPLDWLIVNAPSDAPEHQRFYCKNRLATEIQGAQCFSIIQHDNQPLAQQNRDGNACQTTLLATDQQRSVLNTIKANHPQQPIAYTPYGHRPTASGLLSLLGFNGERPDPVTGYYLLGNGYRGFNPVLMRFNSPDSLSPLGKGGLNSYIYCLGNPIHRFDPSGHFSFALTTKIQNWARGAAARVVARTNTIVATPSFRAFPRRFALKPGSTPTQAVRARSRADHLENLSVYEANAYYTEILTAERANTAANTLHSLQELSVLKIQQSKIPTTTLPKELQIFAKSPLPISDHGTLRHAILERSKSSPPYYGVNTPRYVNETLVDLVIARELPNHSRLANAIFDGLNESNHIHQLVRDSVVRIRQSHIDMP